MDHGCALGLAVLLARCPLAFAQDAPDRASCSTARRCESKSPHQGGSTGNAPIGTSSNIAERRYRVPRRDAGGRCGRGTFYLGAVISYTVASEKKTYYQCQFARRRFVRHEPAGEVLRGEEESIMKRILVCTLR